MAKKIIIPDIDQVIDWALRFTKSPKGHDPDASEARAFHRRLWLEILKMEPEIATKYIAKCLVYYGKAKGKKKGAKK